MIAAASLAEGAAIVHAALGAGFPLVAAAAVAWASRPRRAPAPGAAMPPVVLLRAAEGLDAELARRLAADAAAYDGPMTRVLALPNAAAVASRAPLGLRLAWSDIGPEEAANRKALHLAAALAEAERAGLLVDDAVVVHADADVVLAPGDLTALVRTLLAEAASGAAFAAPAPSGGTRLAELAARAVICASPQAFAALHAVARVTASPPALAGKLVALRARTLAAIGGYARLSPFIADDIALVDALHRDGLPVALSPRPARAVDAGRTVPRLLAQLTRWLGVAASHRPGLLLAYPLAVAPAPLALILAALCAATGHAATGAITLAALFVTRAVLGAVLLRGPYAGTRDPLAASPLGVLAADFALTLAAIGACRRTPIAWAGRAYEVARGGRIVACAIAPAPASERHM